MANLRDQSTDLLPPIISQQRASAQSSGKKQKVGNPSPANNGQPIVDYLTRAQAAIITPDQLAAEKLKQDAEDALLSAGAHDEGHAQAFNLRYRGRFLHSEALGWLYHTGTHWTTEASEAALDRFGMADTLQARIEAALRSGRADQYADLIKRAFLQPVT